LPGGTSGVFTLDCVSATRWQFSQTNTCKIIAGSGFTSVDRVHLISMRQLGQIGGSSCSSERLSFSTMRVLQLSLRVHNSPSTAQFPSRNTVVPRNPQSYPQVLRCACRSGVSSRMNFHRRGLPGRVAPSDSSPRAQPAGRSDHKPDNAQNGAGSKGYCPVATPRCKRDLN
jgi:hypothetical protein